MQSKKWSLIESIVNILVGYFVALCTQLVVFPLLNIPVKIQDNILIGLIFTAVSLARSYTMRRIFNKFTGGSK